ncbi:MAG TPA: hypothetical protein VGD98_23860 [Ktedonobacteraceae bacterium]
MNKSLSCLFCLLSVVITLSGSFLFAGGYTHSTLPGALAHPVDSTAVLISKILLLSASLLALVAWVGALVRLAQLRRWGWFVCLLVFSGIAMPLYIFLGPTTYPPMPMTTPPYTGFGD